MTTAFEIFKLALLYTGMILIALLHAAPDESETGRSKVHFEYQQF